MKNSEQAALEYENRKRMQKLAGIKEEKGGIRPEIKNQIDQLVTNIKNIADEIRKR
jgi:DNA-binding ferritin-like protein